MGKKTIYTRENLSRGISAVRAKRFGITGRANIDFEKIAHHSKSGDGVSYAPGRETIASECLRFQRSWSEEERKSRLREIPTCLNWPGPFCCECGRPVVDESCERTDLACGKCFGFTRAVNLLRNPRQNVRIELAAIEYHGQCSDHFDQDYWLFQIGG